MVKILDIVRSLGLEEELPRAKFLEYAQHGFLQTQHFRKEYTVLGSLSSAGIRYEELPEEVKKVFTNYSAIVDYVQALIKKERGETAYMLALNLSDLEKKLKEFEKDVEFRLRDTYRAVARLLEDKINAQPKDKIKKIVSSYVSGLSEDVRLRTYSVNISGSRRFCYYDCVDENIAIQYTTPHLAAETNGYLILPRLNSPFEEINSYIKRVEKVNSAYIVLSDGRKVPLPKITLDRPLVVIVD